MSEVIEEHLQPIKGRKVKKYSNLLKSLLIIARLNGVNFENLSKERGPCANSIRRCYAAYYAGLLTLTGLDPVASSPQD